MKTLLDLPSPQLQNSQAYNHGTQLISPVHISHPISHVPAAHSTLQASEQRLYTFTPDTKAALRKFRLGTSRAKDAQAQICSHARATPPGPPATRRAGANDTFACCQT